MAWAIYRPRTLVRPTGLFRRFGCNRRKIKMLRKTSLLWLARTRTCHFREQKRLTLARAEYKLAKLHNISQGLDSAIRESPPRHGPTAALGSDAGFCLLVYCYGSAIIPPYGGLPLSSFPRELESGEYFGELGKVFRLCVSRRIFRADRALWDSGTWKE